MATEQIDIEHVLESSIFELLSVTSAAVKALDKSPRSNASDSSQSASSKEKHSSKSLLRSKDLTEHLITDSGIGKTVSAEEENKISNIDLITDPYSPESDQSTTASDVLIRSTLVDPNEKSNLSLNSSHTSKSSQSSRNLENFNHSGTHKVKISRKHLREILSPIDITSKPNLIENGDDFVYLNKSNSAKPSDFDRKSLHISEHAAQRVSKSLVRVRTSEVIPKEDVRQRSTQQNGTASNHESTQPQPSTASTSTAYSCPFFGSRPSSARSASSSNSKSQLKIEKSSTTTKRDSGSKSEKEKSEVVNLVRKSSDGGSRPGSGKSTSSRTGVFIDYYPTIHPVIDPLGQSRPSSGKSTSSRGGASTDHSFTAPQAVESIPSNGKSNSPRMEVSKSKPSPLILPATEQLEDFRPTTGKSTSSGNKVSATNKSVREPSTAGVGNEPLSADRDRREGQASAVSQPLRMSTQSEVEGKTRDVAILIILN